MCKQNIPRSYPKYKGLILIPSASANKELAKYGLLLSEIIEVLEQGFDCSRSKGKKGTVEKCVKKCKKHLKAVIVKSYNFTLEEECWFLIHVGMF